MQIGDKLQTKHFRSARIMQWSKQTKRANRRCTDNPGPVEQGKVSDHRPPIS